MASSIILPSFSLFFFISYNIIMSNEFNSKIQNLSNKLNNLHQPNKREVEVEDVKEQLRKLQDSLQRELIATEKRVSKIENRLTKRISTSRREEQAINSVWNDKQEKVSELIGQWVDTYEQKAEQARILLEREERTFQIKFQEQQQIISKQARMEQNRLKDLLHVLDKELNKLNTINSQNNQSLCKEIAHCKRQIDDCIKAGAQMADERTQEVDWRIGKLKEGLQIRFSEIQSQMSSRSANLKQIMVLLLEVE